MLPLSAQSLRFSFIRLVACVEPGAETERDRKQEGPWGRCQIWNCHPGNGNVFAVTFLTLALG